MLDLFGSLRAIIKRHEITIDNPIFKLHYLFTAIALIGCSLMTSARQYFGNPIDCMENSQIPYINTYCWIHSTFTMPAAHHNMVMGVDAAHPGVVNSKQNLDERRFYAYYQWVGFVLFFQAILFYLPHFLWKTWEGGRLNTIVLGMHIGVIAEDDKNSRKKVLLDYLVRHYHRHNMYCIKYFLSEVLCLLNVFLQMYIMNRFLDGEFMNYGTRVLEFSEMHQDSRSDPMVYVFPRMTKCTFHSYGPSGDIQSHDSLCILPVNIINEKIYVFLWFWMIFLAAITTMLLCYRVFIIAFPRFWPQILHIRCRFTPTSTLAAILRKANLGDWFVFYLLSKNLDPIIFKEVTAELAKKLEASDSNNPS